jgi:hypothetical protein
MQSYSLPQFIEVEDKIIGPLGIKQFLFLLCGGLICLGIWSVAQFSIFFFLLAAPVMIVVIALAFGKFNGRPVMSNVAGLIKFLSSPRIRVYQRTGDKELSEVTKAPRKVEMVETEAPEQVDSRLKRLAYLLDQQSAEEKRLIETGQMKQKWLNQI